MRVLQDREFERVGGTQTLKVDVRVVCATNYDLNEEVAKGRFRPDLFYRLNVYPITVPPLRKRREDIPLLVEYFIPHIASRIGKHIDQVSPQMMEQFMAYDWPGNVRELKNVLERAIITTPDSVLRLPSEFNQTTEKQPGKRRCHGKSVHTGRCGTPAHPHRAQGNQLAHQRSQRSGQDSGPQSINASFSYKKT